MTYIQNGKKITWLEEDPSPPAKVTRISKTYYRSCKFGNLRLAVGDFVLIADLSAGDEDHVDGCEIAEITHMYDTGDPDEKDPCWLTVRWFTRWDLLPPTVRKKLPVGLPQPHPTREVVLDGRPFSPEVLISTVWDKCEVRVLQPYEDPAVERSTRGTLELFVTRFQLQTKPLKLVSISGLDLGFEDERERKRTKTPQKTDAPTTPSQQPPSKEGLSRSGRRRKERSYRDLVEGKTSWEDEDAITISYTSPNKMVMKMSRLTDSKIRQMLLEDDDRDASRASTPSKPEPSRSRGATPVKRDASRASTPSSGGARSAGRGTPRSAGRGSASPSAGCSTPRSARRSLCRQPSLATVTEERSPGAASARPSDPPPARRLFAADAGGAKRRRLSLAADSEDEEEEEEVAPRRGGGRSRAASARRTEELPEESSPEEEWTPAKRRTGRAAASPATPSRGRGRGRGGRSVTASPRTPKVGGTPLVPGRSAGCLDTPGTPLERARSRLHVAAVPEALPCRENEFLDIYTFVEARLMDGTGGCMYVSGVPGTGKTATMREVVRSLQEAVQTGDLPAFQFIEVNGMRLTEPQRAYCQILSELTGTKAVPEHAAQMLDKRFSQPAGRRQPLLLMVDELDLLWTRKQNVLYNLFDWPSRPHARLIVVAIANTMDLPERIMMNRVSSRLGLTRMTFQPYTFKQLQEIVSSRLSGLDAFDPDAIQLVARKVAAVSGDARRALDICRRATELAERGPAAERRHMSPRKAKTTALVAMEHVNAAIQEMFASPKIVAIRSCPAQARSLLQAVVSEFQRTGLEEARLGRVYEQMAAACRFEGVSPPTLSEVFALVSQLTAVRLLHAQHARHDLETRLRLNISVDDVSYAVQEMPDL
ncbi:Origin recognition complex subunit 1 [Amphibalanus amphitrite]|uniref:Origin recognition complex subunit 1 n=1 Tax=Amphibalanus amphitrite TaxID=1232801 RepID=A0A6A4V8V1_AMPAM|nr:Origin recognition complex subunit 1 [Amphibalanus amphitrite]